MSRPLVCALVFALYLSGCAAPEPTAPAVVYDVSPWALARDYPTALSYSGCTVRVRLERDSYAADGCELRVAGGIPFTPPLLVFRCREVPPAGGTLVVTGRVLHPVRDGAWRTTRADFCVVVTDCSVTRLSADHP
jgi:hypothetical protein